MHAIWAGSIAIEQRESSREFRRSQSPMTVQFSFKCVQLKNVVEKNIWFSLKSGLASVLLNRVECHHLKTFT
jgi:hypothetical protein